MAKVTVTKEQIVEAFEKAPTAYLASKLLGVTYTSFVRHAKAHGVYKPNQGGRGTSKPWDSARKIQLDDVFANKVRMKSAKLKLRLYEAGLKEKKCESCGIGDEWNGKPLVLQLDHQDGNPENNMLENLKILCPNCHSQTPTFCRGHGKNGNTIVLD